MRKGDYESVWDAAGDLVNSGNKTEGLVPN